MIRIGVVGYGYWGPNQARNLYGSDSFSLVRIADPDASRLQEARRHWPGVETTTEVADVVAAPDLDAVVIASPTESHRELGLRALRSGKDVLIEKPMADTVEGCRLLIEEAARRQRVLLVGHTFAYTESVAWMRRFVEQGQLGDLYYFDSIRANLGLFRRDVSVLWDLAPHDLSILFQVTGGAVRSVSCVGASHAGSRVPDIAYLSLDLGGGALAHIHVSWLSPVKIRKSVVGGSRRMLVFDDLEVSEKVKVYDSGVLIEHDDLEGKHRMNVEYRIGDMTSPALPAREALRGEIEHFARCIRREEAPRTGGEEGLAVVRVLEAAECSLARGGERVSL